MKILFIVADPKIHPDTHLGYNSRINSFIGGLKANGHIVKRLFAGSAAAQQSAVRMYQGGIRNIFPPLFSAILRDLYKIYADFRFYRRIQKLAGEFQPDLIIQRYTYFNFSGGRLAEKLGCKFLIDANECVDLEMSERPHIHFPFPQFSRKTEKIILKKADVITVPSARFKNYLLQPDLPQERFYVLHNAVCSHKFEMADAIGKKLRSENHLQGRTVVGYAGGFDAYQGVINLVDVAESVLKDRPDVKFVLVGDGSERAKILEKIRAKELSDYFFLPGRVAHAAVPAWISAFDIAVLPASNSYGSPIKIFEYMAGGKPIIAPDVPPVREVLQDRREGLLIENNNAAHLNNAIRRFLKNPGEAAAYAEKARSKVLANFTWDKQTARLMQKIFQDTGRK